MAGVCTTSHTTGIAIADAARKIAARESASSASQEPRRRWRSGSGPLPTKTTSERIATTTAHTTVSTAAAAGLPFEKTKSSIVPNRIDRPAIAVPTTKHPTTALKILPTTIASSVAGTSASPSSTSPRVGLSAKETVGPARPRADMKDPAVPPTSRAPSSIDPK